MKLYTRTGDGGETSLLDGTRVRKDHARVAAYGEVDELNAWIGLALSWLAEADVAGALLQIQRDLFAIGAELADPSSRISSRRAKAAVTAADVERLEGLIDRSDAEPPPLRHFILPGGRQAGAALHVARAVCRRAERRIVALEPPADAHVRQYINRLSDLLFALARVVNRRSGFQETEW